MGFFKIKSILLGVITGVILANFIGFVIGFFVAAGYGAVVLRQFANSTAFLVFDVVISVVISGLAGWVTAKSARVNKLGNAFVMSIVLVVVNALLYAFVAVKQPTWFIYLNRILTIPAVLLGAYLENIFNTPRGKPGV